MGMTDSIQDVWRVMHDLSNSFARGVMNEYVNHLYCIYCQRLTLLQSISSQNAPGLLPYEIAGFVDHELSLPNFGVECSDTYIGTIRTFVEQHIITPLAVIRKQRGLPDGLEKGTRRGADEDIQGELAFGLLSRFAKPIMSTLGIDNTAKVTEDQLRNFLAACRAKFVKAKIEPGTFLPLASGLH